MAKRIQLVDPSTPKQTDSVRGQVRTDWSLCVLCQDRKDEKLVYPDGRRDKQSGYETFANNIVEFHKIGELPLDLDIGRINDGSGVKQTLINNHAGWHKSCCLLFCKMKLQRAQSRAQKRQFEVDMENPSPVKTRQTSAQASGVSKEICIFCEQSGQKESLHLAATSNIDATVRECATELRDSKLLTKLAAGDMVAIDAMYHTTCLVKLRNRLRDHRNRPQEQQTNVSADALVFAELVAHIEETRQNESIIPVFKLSALSKVFAARLAVMEHVDVSKIQVHSTRLKERLLRQIPDLRSEQQGRDVLLLFSKDVGDVIQQAVKHNMDDDAVTLLRASQIVRKEIFETNFEFSGFFEYGCQHAAVPKSLHALVQMILDGPNIENQSHNNTARERVAIAMAELLYFNVVKKSRGKDYIRHNKDREAPLPIYLSMLIHAKTRSKHLIDTLFNLGLCVSYDRLMAISTDLANTVCALYHENQVVCPPQLASGVFTCSAVDNIDHNPSARTANDSFHGTAISLIQFPTSETPGDKRFRHPSDATVSRKATISPLPQRYTVVPPAVATLDPVSPVKRGEFHADQELIIDDFEKEKLWLAQLLSLLKKDKLDDDDYLSWAAYHASKQCQLEIIPSTTALLPLFREHAHTTCMISHAMQMVTDAINHINPTQTPVIVADQPLFAIAKQIQWTWPQTLGEDKIVVMMGGLHIEMNLLKLLGDWLRGSGWITAVVQADVTTTGRAEAMLSGAHVTRTRYAHQVTAGCLSILQKHAYQQYLVAVPQEDNTLQFKEWCVHQCQEQPQFKYWALTLQLELMVLQFIRSIRERNFQMYIQSLLQIVPWLFALDHTNYKRWLPVHIADMVNLTEIHPRVYREFEKGHFAVQKTCNVFSAMSIDQCHEQLNELIKGDGGAVGLTENPQALERWMVAGPEVSRLILEFETSYPSHTSQTSTCHHEQHPATQTTFAKDVNALVSTIEDMGNPFLEDNGDLLTLDTKAILNEEVIQTIYSIEEKGQSQYHEFVKERLTAVRNKPLNDTVSMNKFPLFSASSSKQKSKTKQQMTSLKTNCTLFARLYIACQSRQGDLDSFFQHENQQCPPSLSDMGKLRQGTKSDLLDCLEQCSPSRKESPSVEVKVFDGAAVIHMLRPGGSRTFEDYARKVFVPFIKSQLESVSRVDVIWDRYLPNSLKQSTREKRTLQGTAQRQRVLSSSPIPKNWESFLRIEENKDELFHYLSVEMQNCSVGDKLLVTTYGESIMTAGPHSLQDIELLQPCTHEEADTRILLHVAHCARQGYKRVAIRTVDTDVVVLAVAHFDSLDIEQLWISFGVGKRFRHICAHSIASALNEKAKALMMFHALSGCYTTSSFLGRGKKSAWSAWLACPKATEAFSSLSSQPEEVSPDILHEIESFVVVMYSKTCVSSRVNEARKQLFAQCARNIDTIPPTQAALLQHIKRAVYQAGYIWSQALKPTPALPSPGLWGWHETPSGWRPFWTDLPEAAKSCYELVHCGCKNGCQRRCKCRSSNLKCTELCNCGAGCSDE